MPAAHYAAPSLIKPLFLILMGTLLLTCSSRIMLPIGPVPATMQTCAVLLIGALYGARLGALTILTYFAEALSGLPVLAGGLSGFLCFLGPTGGYLAGFLFSVLLVGWLADNGSIKTGTGAFFTMLAGHTVILFSGFIWLGTLITWKKAALLGVMPFLTVDFFKSLFIAATVRLIRK